MRLALQALGQQPTDESLQQMMEELDTSKNGKIDVNEFLKALTMQKRFEHNVRLMLSKPVMPIEHVYSERV